mmetsp:Transcript_29122/g.46872  ORF Transcript_29122/g.46872 Transcript_29122/m.46872 type:complete len:135 (+) Transcript_29122:189-593(+)
MWPSGSDARGGLGVGRAAKISRRHDVQLHSPTCSRSARAPNQGSGARLNIYTSTVHHINYAPMHTRTSPPAYNQMCMQVGPVRVHNMRKRRGCKECKRFLSSQFKFSLQKPAVRFLPFSRKTIIVVYLAAEGMP